MIIRFKYVKINNFMSFGQQDILVDLDTKNLRAILGRNYDIGEVGASANGVGKSTIFNAIIYTLFGEGIDKLKSDEYINIVNGKKMVVEVGFEAGEDTYVVRRGRKPNFVELTKNGGSLTLDAMRNTDEAIIEVLGFNYEIFMASFFLSPHKKSFMAMSGPEQRGMIENMLSLDVLASRAEVSKTLRSENQVEIKVLQRDIDKTQDTNKQIEQSIARLEASSDRFETDKIMKLAEYRETLTEMNAVNIDGLRALFAEYIEKKARISQLDGFLTKLKEKLTANRLMIDSCALLTAQKHENIELENSFVADQRKKFSSIHEWLDANGTAEKIESLLTDLRHNHQHNRSVARNRRELETLISEHDQALASKKEQAKRTSDEIISHQEGVCQVCGGEYVDTGHIDVLTADLTVINGVLTEMLTRSNELNDKLRELNATPMFEVVDESVLDQLTQDLSTAKAHEATLASGQLDNPYTAAGKVIDGKLAVIKEDLINKESDEMRSEVAEITLERDDLYASVLEYEKVLEEYRITKAEHIDELADGVTSLEESIERLKASVNHFQSEIDQLRNTLVDVGQMEETLRGYEKKELHIGYLIKLLTDSKSFIRRRILDNYVPYLNKKINEYAERLGLPHICEINSDLSVDLTYMSRGVSYYNLSRGERLRLDTATTQAFRDVMGMLGKGCNIALLDEVLDSALDASGIHAALKLIYDSAETVLLITHREELQASVSETITVAKRNGFSAVE